MKKNISILKKDVCTGCGACEQKCPVKAITLEADEEGFMFPALNTEICLNCGLCLKCCPCYAMNVQKLFHREKQDINAAYSNDLAVLLDSASGGLGYSLSKLVVQEGGVVYGCAWKGKADLRAIHIRVDKEDELKRLCQSKYVQSACANTYKQVLQDLIQGRLVLYIGTPCQIAGLRSFLSRDYINLLTVDLICHGVPSPKIFSEYIKYLEKKEKKKIVEFNFRAKKKSGYRSYISYQTAAGMKRYLFLGFDPYFTGFVKGWLDRRSCFSCIFARAERVGDITIGDFWGFEKIYKDQYDKLKYGVSVCLFNTKKGLGFKEKLCCSVVFVPSKLEYAQKQNPALCHSSNIYPLERDLIYKELDYSGFDYLARTLLKPKSNVLYWLIPASVKNYLKKLKNNLKTNLL